jgi:hypothetical protein
VSGQARGKNKTDTRARKNRYKEISGARWLTRQTGNRQTENTGINTLGIMGKTGDTWRWVETITKTGETDQEVTVSPL